MYDFITFDKSIKNISKTHNENDDDDDDHAIGAESNLSITRSKAGERFKRFLRKIDTKNETYLTKVINAEVIDRAKASHLNVKLIKRELYLKRTKSNEQFRFEKKIYFIVYILSPCWIGFKTVYNLN